MKTDLDRVPERYRDITMGELVILYGGDRAHLCPPELLPWLEVAKKSVALDALNRDNARRRAALDLKKS